MKKIVNAVIFSLLTFSASLIMLATLTLVPLMLFWHHVAKPMAMHEFSATAIAIGIFFAALATTFFLNNKLLALVVSKIDADRLFDPAFTALLRRRR